MDNNKEPETIAVIGAGAIGGITAAFLQKAGLDVELVRVGSKITQVFFTNVKKTRCLLHLDVKCPVH